MTSRTHGEECAVKHKRTLAGVCRYHAKWCDFEARIEPEIGLAIVCGNQQVLENGRPGQAFLIAVAGESGNGIEFQCGRESSKQNELVLWSSVAGGHNILRWPGNKSRCTERKIDSSDFLRHKIV